MEKRSVNIKKTKAWKAAEWELSSLYAMQMMPPILGQTFTAEDFARSYREILKTCPQYYPALLELGVLTLQTSRKKSAEVLIKKGFALLLEHTAPRELQKQTDDFIDRLEELWCYDLSQYCLELMVNKQPRNALFIDYLAGTELRLGNVAKAISLSEKAVKLKPDNPFFNCNLGWAFLVKGDITKAGEHLERALHLDPEDAITKGNLKVLRYLKKNGGNYNDYLLRPVDYKKLDKLAEEEEFDQVVKICGDINHSRLEAMAQFTTLENSARSKNLPVLTTRLKTFFGFVHKISDDAYVLNEDISFFEIHFKDIMYKFIYKFGDVDGKILEDIYKALLMFYRFLSDRKIIFPNQYNDFRTRILDMKGELIEKMEHYNKVRHDDNITPEEKDDICEELFEDVHWWPGL